MKSFIADKQRKLSKLALYNIEDLSFSAFMKALRHRDIKVNGKRVSSDVILSVGDKVEIYFVENKAEKYNEIFKDDNIIVIDKKKGYSSESVFESLKNQIGEVYFIHRLDRNTSGIMIFALNHVAEKALLSGFKNRTFEKYYKTEVVGRPKISSAVLSAYLTKDEKQAVVKVTSQAVKGSVQIKTGYEVVENRLETSVLKVSLFTGKTHQIRAHLAFIGHPIVGDGKYGDFAFNQKIGASVQRLNAESLIKIESFKALSFCSKSLICC